MSAIDTVAALHPDIRDALKDEDFTDAEIERWLVDHNNKVRAQVRAEEPSDAEIDAAAEAIAACDNITFSDLRTRNPGLADQYRKQARAALNAARKEAQ